MVSVMFEDVSNPRSPTSSVYNGLGDFTVPTSSPLDQATARHSTRDKRPPTITPRRFTRFFAPRHYLHNTRESARAQQSARRLKDITRNAINSPQGLHDRATRRKDQQYEAFENGSPRRKRARLSDIIDSSPVHSPSTRGNQQIRPMSILEDSDCETEVLDDDDDDMGLASRPSQSPITRLGNKGPVARILERSFGGLSVNNRGRLKDHCVVDWRHETADFYSSPEDTYRLKGTPFCSAACQTNSLVAVGDDAGDVHLIDSLQSDDVDFRKKHITISPHNNAVIDLAFSSNDLLMATASGDQSTRITDMRTQQTVYLLPGHTSSVKQVRFQPGNDNILATSSRDGSVQIWDLRTGSTRNPVAGIHKTTAVIGSRSRQVIYANNCISIRDAHAVGTSMAAGSANMFKRGTVTRHSDVSITAISFLPQGREHYLLSASEANSSIKLWDIRSKNYSRRGPAMPLSLTAEPPSHIKCRPYGLSSMALGGDGSRIYTLCRDNSIYAYSTSDLVLGNTPGQRYIGSSSEELGTRALYRFKHPALRVESFYVKLAIRPARGDKPEILAAGSSADCPVVLPTDETYLRQDTTAELTPYRPPVPSSSIGKDSSGIRRPVAGHVDETPIHQMGTALVRGHNSEVSALSWTNDGDLVAASDDHRLRCWRSGPRARDLRLGGEQDGRRWNCGWADVAADYDEDI